MRNPVGLSYLWGCFMYQYPKQILTIDQQVQSYIDAGMEITSREDIIKLYQFDQELSALVFPMISKIEVALRVRLVEALLIHGEPLVLQDSSIFKEKKRYWQNAATVASENAYFMDTGRFGIA